MTQHRHAIRALVLGLPFLLLAGLAAMWGRADAVVTRAEHSRDCVMCHIEWGDDYDKLSPMLPPPSHRVMIDGQPARNSSEEMCWSCHDAYVCDDRDSFMEMDPHLTKHPIGVKAGKLPLDLDGKVYCGTCHTPHSHTMGRKFEMSPFLRGEYLGSELCLNCHSDHTGGPANHPLHKALGKGRGAALASFAAPKDRVECLSCHDMHKSHSARLTQDKDLTPLCAACHENQTVVEDTRHGRAVAANPKGSCAGCHSTHASAKLPVVRGDEACLRCHTEKPGHGESGWAHPLGVSPESSGGLPLRQGEVGCASCHDPHRWSPLGQKDEGQDATPAGSFLRRADQRDEGLCQSCHPRHAAILTSSHGASTSFANMAGSSVWRCSNCHNAHGADLLQQPKNSTLGLSAATRLCLDCHGDGASGDAASIGHFSHPVGKGYGALRPSWLPRDAGETVGCESCHNPHQWSPAGETWTLGAEGGESSSFLRTDNRDGALCMDCHEDQSQVLGSAHDRRAQPGASANACAACHSPHQAATAALLSPRVAGPNLDHLLPESDWTPDSREHKAENWSAGAMGCLACHHDSDAGQRVPQAWFHPSWESGPLPEQVAETHRDLHIDCRSCHNPHKAWRHQSGDARVQFLTAHSSETLCSTCHGDEALWRYNYYHNPERRRP
jgi:predicted CXXCH cytochrome family protein